MDASARVYRRLSVHRGRQPGHAREATGRAGRAVGYVSQHSLLHQCAGLQEHFSVPEQCMGRVAAANAWLGTFDTTTHLHTDEANNILCQIGGHKLVRLWPPEVGDACFHVETRGGNGAYNKSSRRSTRGEARSGKVSKVRGCAREVPRRRARAGRFALHSEGGGGTTSARSRRHSRSTFGSED